MNELEDLSKRLSNEIKEEFQQDERLIEIAKKLERLKTL